jgi:hypothetical protein
MYFLALKPKTERKIKLSANSLADEDFAREIHAEVSRYFQKEKLLDGKRFPEF